FRLAGVWGRLNPIGTYPSDKLGHEVASAMQKVGDQRDHLTNGIYIPKDPTEAVGKYEYAMDLINAASHVYKVLLKAIKKRELPKAPILSIVDEAVDKKIITSEEAEHVRKAEIARDDAIQVDDFSLEEYMAETVRSPLGNGVISEDLVR
ncbi:MAG: acyl-CoA dehydrogenase domain-containing protein, partial [Balneolaceae bacterium]